MPAAEHSKLNRFAQVVLIAVIFAAMPRAVAHAAEIGWKKTPYNHYAQDEDIKDVLTDFFASQGIGVICSENVKGKISGNFIRQNPQVLFKHLTDTYNLIWYYDGAATYIYSAHEISSRVISLGYLNMNDLKQQLAELDILDPNYAMRMVEKERIIYLSGPERYVKLISDVALQLDAKAQARRGSDDVVRIYRLKHAWADDRTLVFRDQEITIPGVATLLVNLISGAAAPGEVPTKNRDGLSAGINRLKGRGLARFHPQSIDQPPGKPEKETSIQNVAVQSGDTPPPVQSDTGFVQADTRQNAVVVRDREEQFPFYEQLIDLLDAPVPLVEIRATIIDIDRNDFDNMGVQWEFTSTGNDGERVVKGGLNTTGVSDPETGLTPAAGFNNETGLQLPAGTGLNLATLIGDASNFFLARVNALQRKGHARILSRPSVLTLNNIEAQLEHSKTFYVRVAGREQVDLFDINAGVVLRVTPHIIEENSQALVKLAVQIEDGELSDEEVDKIPVVNKSVINTQAVVGQQESLLIGGYFKESSSTTRYIIPCLGEVPIIGWLFKKKESLEDQYERLFMISPKIVPYGPGNDIVLNGRTEPQPAAR